MFLIFIIRLVILFLEINIKNKTDKVETCKSPHGQSLFDKIYNNKDRHPKKFNKMIKMDLNACK